MHRVLKLWCRQRVTNHRRQGQETRGGDRDSAFLRSSLEMQILRLWKLQAENHCPKTKAGARNRDFNLRGHWRQIIRNKEIRLVVARGSGADC